MKQKLLLVVVLISLIMSMTPIGLAVAEEGEANTVTLLDVTFEFPEGYLPNLDESDKTRGPWEIQLPQERGRATYSCIDLTGLPSAYKEYGGPYFELYDSTGELLYEGYYWPWSTWRTGIETTEGGTLKVTQGIRYYGTFSKYAYYQEWHMVIEYVFEITDSDGDGDGIINEEDNCPDVANPGQEDVDSDEVGDVCDNCPDVANTDQNDMDGDDIGDVCDDSDGDDVTDDRDLCRDTPPGTEVDEDGCPATPTLSIVVQTDSDAYPQSDKIRIYGDVRDEQNKAVQGATVSINLKSPSGMTYTLTTPLTTDSDGWYSTSFSETTEVGKWMITATASKDGYQDDSDMIYVTVAEVGEGLVITASCDTTSYMPGETVTVMGKVYFGGKEVPAATVTVKFIDPNGNLRSTDEVIADGWGFYEVRYTLSTDAPVGTWSLDIQAEKEFDEGYQEGSIRIETCPVVEEAVPITKLSITSLYTTKAEYSPTEKVRLNYHIKNVGTMDVDKYQVTYKIMAPDGRALYTHKGREHSIEAGEDEEWYSEEWQVPSDAEPGEYELEATLTWDSESAKKTTTFIVKGGKLSVTLNLEPSKPTYVVGDVIEITGEVSCAGRIIEGAIVKVKVTVNGKDWEDSDMTGSEGTYRSVFSTSGIDIEASKSVSAKITAQAGGLPEYEDSDTKSETVTITGEVGILEINIETDKPSYEQGEAVTITGHVLYNNEPTPPYQKKIVIEVSVPDCTAPASGCLIENLETDDLGRYSIMPFAGWNTGKYSLFVKCRLLVEGNFITAQNATSFQVVKAATVTDMRPQLEKIIPLYKKQIPWGPMWSDPEIMSWLKVHGTPESHYGREHNLRFAGTSLDPHSEFVCGGYQVQVLNFFNSLRFHEDPDVRQLLKGLDYGPIARGVPPKYPFLGGHVSVVLYPIGSSWKPESPPRYTGQFAKVFDPWPKQKPEVYSVIEFGGFWQLCRVDEFAKGQTDPNDIFTGYPLTGGVIYVNYAVCGKSPGSPPPPKTSVVVQCAVDVLVTDSQGKRTGMVPNGSFVQEFPAYVYHASENGETLSWYFGLPDGVYQATITGTADGEFNLLTGKGDGVVQDYGEQPITQGAQAHITLDPSNPTAPLILPDGEEVQPETMTFEKKGILSTIYSCWWIIVAASAAIAGVVLLLRRRRKPVPAAPPPSPPQ